MYFCIHSVISQKVMHLGKILLQQILFSIRFYFELVYFQAGKLRGLDVLKFTLKKL